MADISGTCDERFEKVRSVLADNLDRGADLGASVAVSVHGEPVVDIWGGFADEARTIPWQRDTITNVWSTTKTMTFLCALLLVDRGELDVDAPVCRYWPEFAAAGKEGVEVRHVLGHTAGLSGWAERLEPEDLADWERCTTLLARQEPWWEPGSASGYHALTQGYLIGEVVRRITGQTIGAWFREQVAEPLGADFAIGLPEADDVRVAPVVAPPPLDTSGLDFSDIGIRTFLSAPIDAAMTRNAWWRRAEIPAANGHGNARSVAAAQSVVAGRGEARGVRLLSEGTCRRIFEVQSDGVDLVLGVPLRFGMGYGLSSETMPIGPEACFWGGYGGSLVVMDQASGLTVAYVMNRMEAGIVGDARGASILQAAVTAAGDL